MVVPDGAVPGPLSLRVREKTVAICGHFHEIHRRGNEFEFLGGGAPPILLFTANLAEDLAVLSPDTPLTLRWVVHHTATSVRIESAESVAKPGPSFDSLDNTGSVVVPAPEGLEQTLSYEFTLIAAGPCGTIAETVQVVWHRVANVSIADVEVTQATQFLRAADHMDPNSTAIRSDNSVSLIGNKATLVRVFPATDQALDFNLGLSTGATVQLRGFNGDGEMPGSPLSPLAPDPLRVLREPLLAKRARYDSSFNFVLPPSWTSTGANLNLRAELSMAGDAYDIAPEPGSRFVIEGLVFQTANPLDCMLIRIDYTGPQPESGQGTQGTLGAPSRTNARNTILRVRRMFPTHRIYVYGPADPADDIIEESAPLTVDGLTGWSGWDNVIAAMAVRAAGMTSDDNMIWCGVARADVPVFTDGDGSSIAGVGSGNLPFARGYATFRDGQPTTAAHEMCHALDRPHHGADPDWPNQGPAGPDLRTQPASSV